MEKTGPKTSPMPDENAVFPLSPGTRKSLAPYPMPHAGASRAGDDVLSTTTFVGGVVTGRYGFYPSHRQE